MAVNLSASSEVNTPVPLAAPGDAGKPLAITFIELFWAGVRSLFPFSNV